MLGVNGGKQLWQAGFYLRGAEVQIDPEMSRSLPTAEGSLNECPSSSLIRTQLQLAVYPEHGGERDGSRNAVSEGVWPGARLCYFSQMKTSV